MSTTSPRPDVSTSTLPVPQPTHPVAGRTITEKAPEFHWTAVPEAEAYRLQLAASDAFDALYYDETVEGPTAVDLAEVLPDDVDSGVWRVRVEADEPTAWSTAAFFTVAEERDAEHAEFLVEAPPVPIRPIHGDTVNAEGTTLTWEGVPEASGYRVQVGTSESFNDPVVNLTLDDTTTLTLFDALPEEQTPLYWKVRALFRNNTEGPWSEAVQFGTSPDVAGGQAQDAEKTKEERAAGSSVERSAVAAGPAQHANTSSGMALAFIAVLLISFLLTILAVMASL